MSDPQVKIEAVCAVHFDAGRLVVRSEGERIVLNAHADDCVTFLNSAAVTGVIRPARTVAGVNRMTRWVICPADGQTHSLAPVGDHPLRVLVARCGRLLPVGVPQHEQLPGWQLCVTCLWRYLVPARMFSPHSSAGRWSNSDGAPSRGVPGGQPVPAVDDGTDQLGCSADQQ